MNKKRKKSKEPKFYFYECTLSGEKYRLTRQAPSPEELVSVSAYYEMHPEKDDRSQIVKKELGVEEVSQ